MKMQFMPFPEVVTLADSSWLLFKVLSKLSWLDGPNSLIL